MSVFFNSYPPLSPSSSPPPPSSLQLENIGIHRYQFVILAVCTKELVNEINVLKTTLSDTESEALIFPKQVVRRVIWKIEEIIKPQFKQLPLPGTEPISTKLNSHLNQIYLDINNLRQNLMLISGNMDICDKLFVNENYYLLTMVKREDPYFKERVPHILNALNIVLSNSMQFMEVTEKCLASIDNNNLH